MFQRSADMWSGSIKIFAGLRFPAGYHCGTSGFQRLLTGAHRRCQFFGITQYAHGVLDFSGNNVKIPGGFSVRQIEFHDFGIPEKHIPGCKRSHRIYARCCILFTFGDNLL